MSDVLGMAAAYVEQMAADHEAAAVHLLASPNRVPVALDEARVREGVATNLRNLARWLREQVDVPAEESTRPRYPAGHGYTPHTGPFGDRGCRVMLARYPCNWSRDEHDPELPPVDVDVFGYRRNDRPTRQGQS